MKTNIYFNKEEIKVLSEALYYYEKYNYMDKSDEWQEIINKLMEKVAR